MLGNADGEPEKISKNRGGVNLCHRQLQDERMVLSGPEKQPISVLNGNVICFFSFKQVKVQNFLKIYFKHLSCTI